MKYAFNSAFVALVVQLTGCAGTELPVPPPESPEPALTSIAHELVTRSGAPGVLLGVVQGERRWVVSAGSGDLLGHTPMRHDGIFPIGSLTKMFTGALVMQEVEAGKLELSTPLSRFVPEFPNAEAITLDMLLAHTAGVTTRWFDEPGLQATVTASLERPFTLDEVIARMAQEPPLEPGSVRYSNTGYVLLGKALTQVSGVEFARLLEQRIFSRLGLKDTSYPAPLDPARRVHGYFELNGLPLDARVIPQTSLTTFAGPAGAVYSTADDLLDFAEALLRSHTLVSRESLAHMMAPAEEGSVQAHALMRFCPCTETPSGRVFSGFGHGGLLPGTWSVLVYYPERDITVVAMLNRDSVQGRALDESVFDPTLTAVLAALDE